MCLSPILTPNLRSGILDESFNREPYYQSKLRYKGARLMALDPSERRRSKYWYHEDVFEPPFQRWSTYNYVTGYKLVTGIDEQDPDLGFHVFVEPNDVSSCNHEFNCAMEVYMDDFSFGGRYAGPHKCETWGSMYILRVVGQTYDYTIRKMAVTREIWRHKHYSALKRMAQEGTPLRSALILTLGKEPEALDFSTPPRTASSNKRLV